MQAFSQLQLHLLRACCRTAPEIVRTPDSVTEKVDVFRCGGRLPMPLVSIHARLRLLVLRTAALHVLIGRAGTVLIVLPSPSPPMQLWRGAVGAVDWPGAVRRWQRDCLLGQRDCLLSNACMLAFTEPLPPAFLPDMLLPSRSLSRSLSPSFSSTYPPSGMNYHALMLRLANPAEQLRPPLPGNPDWEGEF